jgi:hypothetical protein
MPVQYVLVDDQAPPVNAAQESKRVELDLPTVMKLWRNRGSKYAFLSTPHISQLIFLGNFRYLSILYNDEAFASESSEDEYAASKGCGLYLSPVVFDAEASLVRSLSKKD